MIIRLMNSGGFKWFFSEGIYAKGYLVDGEKRFYRDERLIDYFKGIKNEEDFKERLINANGFFAVVVNLNDTIFAAVDRLRSIPLFFGCDANKLWISDNSFYLYKKLSKGALNDISCKEFLITGYVTGNRTLSGKVMQLRAGEYLVYYRTKSMAISKVYFQYIHENLSYEAEDLLLEKMDYMHMETFKELIESLEGRMAVIPLSGGLDSRLVAIMLKRLGYTKVTCFSYGIGGNLESEISKKIAESLGFKWIFIEYDREKWYSFYNSNKRVDYYRYCGGIASLPHAQDWIAVEKIKEEKLVPDDAVFIPGHSYDFIQGGHLPFEILKRERFTLEDLIELILKRHYSLNSWDKEYLWEEFSNRVKFSIGKLSCLSQEEAANALELWDWQERQAKFICNSVRVYEYFNYEWRMPLWDNEMMNFWSRVPIDKRMGRRLFFLYNDIFCSKYIVLEGGVRRTGLSLKEIKNYNRSFMTKVINKGLRMFLKSFSIHIISEIKSIAKQYKKFKKLEELYYNHPLAVFGIMSFDEFIEEYKGARNVNSLLVKRWLRELKQEKNNNFL